MHSLRERSNVQPMEGVLSKAFVGFGTRLPACSAMALDIACRSQNSSWGVTLWRWTKTSGIRYSQQTSNYHVTPKITISAPPRHSATIMSDQVLYIAVLIGLYLLYRFSNSTDTPKIKGIPEIPGVPIFGNLIQLGTDHARVAQKWAAKYGPVFQTRLGTKVST